MNRDHRTSRYVLQAYSPLHRDESKPSRQSAPWESTPQGEWVDVVGIIGADALSWAETLVRFGNHRLVAVADPAPVRQRAAMSSRRNRSTYTPLRAALGDCPEARAMHIVPTRIYVRADRKPSTTLASLVSRFELASVRSILAPLASR